MVCPCGTGQAFADCCQPYLTGTAIAPTAVALMRSRYSAFATGHVDYLVSTHHPKKRTFGEKAELKQSCANTEWIRLQIFETFSGKESDDTGVVEFEAVYRSSEMGQLHERSNFVKEDGSWFYVDGQMLPPSVPKRGEPCWCGSGKKYKKCHG